MTNEEAIKILKQSKLCTNMICGDPLEICRYSKDVEEAVEKAIETLEKQVAKKPNETKIVILPISPDSGGVKFGNCPVCNNSLNEVLFPFCPTCGQKIDWR